MKKIAQRKLHHSGGAVVLALAIYILPGCKKEADPTPTMVVTPTNAVPVNPPPSTAGNSTTGKIVDTNKPVAKDTTVIKNTKETMVGRNTFPGTSTNAIPRP
jgi:hypothetical protein